MALLAGPGTPSPSTGGSTQVSASLRGPGGHPVSAVDPGWRTFSVFGKPMDLRITQNCLNNIKCQFLYFPVFQKQACCMFYRSGVPCKFILNRRERFWPPKHPCTRLFVGQTVPWSLWVNLGPCSSQLCVPLCQHPRTSFPVQPLPP